MADSDGAFAGGDDIVASPIEHDELSASQFDITQLSLPDSFDESFCLDLYNDLLRQNRKGPKGSQICTLTKMLDDTDRNELVPNIRPSTKIQIESTTKGRYDSRHMISSEHGSQVDARPSQPPQQRISHNCPIADQKELQRQIDNYKQKIHQMGIDLKQARNECALLLCRTENAEKEHKSNASACKISQLFEDERLRTIAEREEMQCQHEWDLCRMREDCTLEITSSRTHQNEAFARESKLLCDARDQAIDQSKQLQQELSEIRHDREAKDVQNNDIIKELERQLADVRSDLKVKTFELSALLASNDRTMAEATNSQTECKKCKEALALLQKEYSDLQVRAIKLEEANRQKDNALEVYHHEDLLVDCGNTTDIPSNDYVCERISLVKNSTALARKCRELQSLMDRQSKELSVEREKNEALSRKLESSQQLFKELSAQSNKNASAYIISTVQARDREILKLNSKISALEGNLKTAAQDRDDLSSKLSKVLERRDQLDEMKALVTTMRSGSMASMRLQHAPDKTESYDALDDEDEDDLLEHTVHHSFIRHDK
ncbi:hypothetical protein ACHAXH_005157 [Discostella pseudostelligera]